MRSPQLQRFRAIVVLLLPDELMSIIALESGSTTIELADDIEAIFKVVRTHIREGRFQRSLALITAGSALASTLEVTYEHYKGSYSNPVMYSPVVLGAILTAASFWAVMNGGPAIISLRTISALMLIDGAVGFVFHVRGIARKPGGWRLPVTNIVMGPPIFAPVLFGTAAYLGIMASYLQREGIASATKTTRYSGWRLELHHGRFQKHLAGVTAVWTICSGFEAWYSHYKSNFKYKAQWTPVILSPILLAGSLGTIVNRRFAKALLLPASALALADGAAGFFYHARGILRRPGGKEPATRVHKLLYGPPIFAPLLFAACGMLGALSCLLRREGER